METKIEIGICGGTETWNLEDKAYEKQKYN